MPDLIPTNPEASRSAGPPALVTDPPLQEQVIPGTPAGPQEAVESRPRHRGQQSFLLPYWQSRLSQFQGERVDARDRGARSLLRLPRTVLPEAGPDLPAIASKDRVLQVLRLAAQRPVSYVGLATAVAYDAPGVPLPDHRLWFDPRSVRPLLVALALVESGSDGLVVLTSLVVDVQVPEALPALGSLLTRPWTYVLHGATEALFVLWQLRMPIPQRVWDSRVAEQALALGRYHPQYLLDRQSADVSEQALAREQANEAAEEHYSLVQTCHRHGVPCPFAGREQHLQTLFLTHQPNQPFREEEIQYLGARALAVAQLYPPQVQASLTANCLDHLIRVEVPWSITNARMTWDGVKLNPETCRQLITACRQHGQRLANQLAELGLDDVNSPSRLKAFFGAAGLLFAFRAGDGFCFDDDRLEAIEDRSPAARLIRALRKVRRLLADKLLTGELVGADGRLHPEHVQLGAATGRNTMRAPNIGGIGRALRPVIVPAEGYAIGEVDLSQIEVGIAAALHDDPGLIRMFNSHDLYSAMAQSYYASALPPEALVLSSKKFKKHFRRFRDPMKVVTLAMLYGITPHGLSILLNISEATARAEQQRFRALFPALAQGLEDASGDGALRGYAEVCSGLRRHRGRSGQPNPWEVNWLRNTPVQGSCAVVFKDAGNRLYRRLQHYGARLILPLHDAFIFETPRPYLHTVARITAEELRGAVQAWFPELDPKVEINVDNPSCWNKDGKWRSLRLWMIHPEFAREYLES